MMILNITNGKINRFNSIDEVIEGYCLMSLGDKLTSFVLGVSDKAMDYPDMMAFMLNMDKHDKLDK